MKALFAEPVSDEEEEGDVEDVQIRTIAFCSADIFGNDEDAS